MLSFSLGGVWHNTSFGLLSSAADLLCTDAAPHTIPPTPPVHASAHGLHLLVLLHAQAICGFLPISARCQARLVCSSWRRLAGEAVRMLGFSVQQLKTQVGCWPNYCCFDGQLLCIAASAFELPRGSLCACVYHTCTCVFSHALVINMYECMCCTCHRQCCGMALAVEADATVLPRVSDKACWPWWLVGLCPVAVARDRNTLCLEPGIAFCFCQRQSFRAFHRAVFCYT